MKFDIISQGATNKHDRTSAHTLNDIITSRRYDRVRAAVAYVTNSGLKHLCTHPANGSFQDYGLQQEWIVSIDFGRTEPSAIRELHNNSSVRVYDGMNVLGRPRFSPERVFHPKVFLFYSSKRKDIATIYTGSSNITPSGLQYGVEHGIKLILDGIPNLEGVVSDFRKWWRFACKMSTAVTPKFLSDYEKKWSELANRGELQHPVATESSLSSSAPASDGEHVAHQKFNRWANARCFFIDTGVAGANLPSGGNQLDAPRGVRAFFGFSDHNLPKDSPIGEVEIKYGTRSCLRGIRYGNNSMDKINLPGPGGGFPEEYRNVCLLFERAGTGFLMKIAQRENVRRKWVQSAEAVNLLYAMKNSDRQYGFFG